MKELITEFLDDNFNPVDKSREPEYRIYCPFCDGGRSRDFSFDVNVEKGTARCWRAKCFWRGSFAKFLVDYLKIEYRDAYKIIEGEAPKDADELLALIGRLQKKADKGVYNEQEDLFLPIDSFPKGSVRVQDSNAFKGVCRWLAEKRNYNPEKFLEQHSLFIPSQYSKYSGRVLFRVTSEDHLAFIAYAMDKNMMPKTLNPGGRVLSRMLYNYNDSRNKKMMFICEGVFDAARLKSWGWGAVAIFGVSLSIEQIGLLERASAKEIVICLDNGTEELAYKMAREISYAIPDKDVSVMILEVSGEDPDDIDEATFDSYFINRRKYIRENVDTLYESINNLIKQYR